jgi:hypothetical protein
MTFTMRKAMAGHERAIQAFARAGDVAVAGWWGD